MICKLKSKNSESKGKEPNDRRVVKNHNYASNDHINNIYKIYAPYIKQSPVKYNKYSIDKNKDSGSSNIYLKNLEKYYDYYNVYKPKKNIIEIGKSVVPNRRLSPLKKGAINQR